MKKYNWKWMPHPGHFICSSKCRFFLNTYVGGYIVSTVGEYWPERGIREIHAKAHDKQWFEDNVHLKGDYFDKEYFDRFGYDEIGAGRKYETMVFKAGKSKEICCPYTADDWSGLDSRGYNNSGDAYKGHLELCKKYAKKRPTHKPTE